MTGRSRDGFKTYMAFAIAGVLVLVGAFACATGVGVIALLAALVIGVGVTVVVRVKGHSLAQIHQQPIVGAQDSGAFYVAEKLKDVSEAEQRMRLSIATALSLS